MSTGVRRAASGLYLPFSVPATPAAYVSSASGSATATVTKPSGLNVGDHLMIVCVENSATVTATGFRSMAPDVTFVGNYGHVLYREIDGTEGSTFTLSTASTWIAIAYRGGMGPPGILGGVPGQSGTSCVSRLIAPVDGLVIHVYTGVTGSAPAAFTPPGTVNSRVNVAAGSYWGANVSDEVVTAGTDASRTATVTSGASTGSFAFFIPTNALIPVVVGRASSSTSSTAASITIPSTAQIGDLFVCGFQVTANSMTSGPTGFTALDGPATVTGGTYSCGYWWGYKVLVSGDPGSTISCSNGNQIWSSAGLVIRNPKATPVLLKGTLASGTGTGPAIAVTASAPAIAVALVISSNNGGENTSIDVATIKGFTWASFINDGYGEVGLAVMGVPSGNASLAPDVSHANSPTRVANTVLLNAA